MNSPFRNVLLFIAVLVLSYFAAPYIGIWYDHFYPQYGEWIVSKKEAVDFAGFLLAYMFFLPFVFQLFASGNKKKIILWLLAPLILFYLYDSITLTYIPIIAIIIGFCLAFIIQKVFKLKA